MNKFKYIKLNQPQLSSPFCVDGRFGKREKDGHKIKEAYPQILGGSLNTVILSGILKKDKHGQIFLATQELISLGRQVFTELRNYGFGLGLHTGSHANIKNHHSDCGFADNLSKIINYLRGKHQENIWRILTQSKLVNNRDKNRWDKIVYLLNQINLEKIPHGEAIINILRDEKEVAFQTLEGSHNETAALINFRNGQTLDVDHCQKKPAFNLDMWRVTAEAKALRINVKAAELLTLGLYIATEIALVEDKGKERLPIIIQK